MAFPPSSEGENELGDIVNNMWTLNATYLIFYMQAGFCMLEAGVVRAKNAKSIIVKNIIDTSIGTLLFWAIGFGFAFGTSEDNNNGFIGSGNFFLIDYSHFAFWSFQWAFSATAANIVSGSMAERTHMTACIVYSIVMSSFIYPIPTHWIWSPDGWLKRIGENGLVDFAGASVVHMVGGCVGLIGAYMVGPRIGRFDENRKPVPMPPHSSTLSTLGSFILWYGFYGFNTGSTIGVTEGRIYLAAKIAVTTTICASSACTTTLFFIRYKTGNYDITSVMNGLLTGLVASSACCAVVEPYAALIIGMLSALTFLGFSRLLIYLQIDDPLNSAPIHLGGGALGILSVGFFATKNGMNDVYPDTEVYGAFYGGGGEQLGIQILGIVMVILWAGASSFVLFFILNKFHILRIEATSELVGIDNVEHGGSAYPNFQHI